MANPSDLPLTDDKTNVRPVTTLEEDKHTQSQRSINKTWEITQSILALTIILTAEIVVVLIVYTVAELRSSAFTFLTTVVGTVIGFYFGRTNHQRVGGVDLGR